MRKVIKRTPVGVYKDGMLGGTLRRGWSTFELEFGDSVYRITIINNTEYASYVEFGHRKKNGKGWVKGKFMLTLSEEEIQKDAPKILERKIAKWLREELS